MKRNGFTMVELIFVIIIIGILSVAAIPKFGDIKDRAKVNTEYSALSGLDSAIVAAMEFHADDNDGNIGVIWSPDPDGNEQTYNAANAAGEVFNKIAKKGDNLEILKYINMDENGSVSATANSGSNGAYDILFITGAASDSSTGVKQPTAETVGKPDKNDFWIFNGSPVTVYVNHFADIAAQTVIESGEIKLIDNDAIVTDFTNVGATGTSTEVGVSLASGGAILTVQ